MGSPPNQQPPLVPPGAPGSAGGAAPPGPVVPPAPVYTAPSLATHTQDQLDLLEGVKEALRALPFYFESPLNITGVPATDLHTFNTSLSGTIELEVVNLLNRIRRDTWDKAGRWSVYAFERQAQRFPDVVLRNNDPNAPSILIGIELKGWYVLAKEGEPSFRYAATPAVSTDLDLVAVIPWAFSNVNSGTPFLYEPYITGAKFAAEYRNWHWQFAMASRTAGTVRRVRAHITPLERAGSADPICRRSRQRSRSSEGKTKPRR